MYTILSRHCFSDESFSKIELTGLTKEEAEKIAENANRRYISTIYTIIEEKNWYHLLMCYSSDITTTKEHYH